jgi:pyruvate/2-oxoacid:ferredoxin oxidoreductase alpha subunit
MHLAMERAKQVIKDVGKEFGEHFGRTYDLVEAYRCEDAENILITYGTIAGTAKDAVDVMRDEGQSVGTLKIRYFRPFPSEDIREHVRNAKRIGVIDRAISYGHAGPFFTETQGCLYNQHIPLYGFIAGLGGRDVSIHDIKHIVNIMMEQEAQDLIWIGVKDGK